jgi:uncharacterized protein YwqG/ankyrin repeat protein
MKAITHHDVEEVRLLLQAGMDVTRRHMANYPLEAAIGTGDRDLVLAFLGSGVDVNLEYGEPEHAKKETALIFAVQQNRPEICRLLIAEGADPNYLQINAHREEDQTPLEIAIDHHHQEIFEILMEQTDLSLGRGLHYEGRHIHLACRAGNLEMVRTLLDRGVEVNLRGGVNEITPLHVAVAEDHPAVVALLLERGADVNAPDRRLNVPLHSVRGCEVARMLIAHQAAVNAPNDFGETPIFKQHHPEIVQLLLENGAHVNVRCNSGETPLHMALKSAAYPYRVDPSNDGSPSDEALRASGRIAALLVAHGADVKAAARGGATPLHYACRAGALETIALFLRSGADVNACSSGLYDGTPLHVAVEAKRGDVCNLLIESGAGLNAPNSDGDTPLHLAAASDYRRIAQLLLAGGADAAATDDAGETALDLAVNLHEIEIVKLLGGPPPLSSPPVNKILPSISLEEYKQNLVIPESLRPYKESLLDSVLPFIDIIPQPDDALHPWESKFGGRPYLPRGCPYPLDGEGTPLFFLAQINFAETPRLEGFPSQGIVAFYIYANYVHSLTADNTRQERFRVFYFERVLQDYDALTTDFDFLPLFEAPPVERPLGLRFRLDYAPVSNEDYRFEEKIGRDFYEVDPGMSFAETMAFFKMRRCKVGGYPGTTQDYPIDADMDRDLLLLQISSGEEITWGDGGLANFFISPQDLLKRDFSRVLYNWNCG